MQSIELHQGVGKDNQGRHKEIVKIAQQANSLHRLGVQEKGSFPVYVEEYCISKICYA